MLQERSTYSAEEIEHFSTSRLKANLDLATFVAWLNWEQKGSTKGYPREKVALLMDAENGQSLSHRRKVVVVFVE